MAAAMATATAKMVTGFSIGQTLRGSAGVYTILDKIQDYVWTAKFVSISHIPDTPY